MAYVPWEVTWSGFKGYQLVSAHAIYVASFMLEIRAVLRRSRYPREGQGGLAAPSFASLCPPRSVGVISFYTPPSFFVFLLCFWNGASSKSPLTVDTWIATLVLLSIAHEVFAGQRYTFYMRSKGSSLSSLWHEEVSNTASFHGRHTHFEPGC